MATRIQVFPGASGITAVSFGGVNVPLGGGNYTELGANKPANSTWSNPAIHNMQLSAGRFVDRESYTVVEANDTILKLSCPTPASPDVIYRP